MDTILTWAQQIAQTTGPVTCISARPLGVDMWEVCATVNAWAPAHETDNPLPHHVITVDRRAIPDGVEVSDYSRVPDARTVIGPLTDTQIEAQMREAATAGHAPDIARIGDTWYAHALFPAPGR